MEWVETTGKSVEEATELALDQLGVLDAEADLEVLEEPKQGMFGRVRGNARVRARVRPSAPPPKTDRQRRGRKTSNDDPGRSGDSSEDTPSKDGRSKKRSSGGRGESSDKAASRGSDKSGSGGAGRGKGGASSDGGDRDRSRKTDREPMPEDEQRGAGEEFLVGLLEAFGLEASVSSSLDSEGILAFDVDGESLGLLMGPGLNTLDAVQEVCRNSIQRQAEGREYGKVIVDVSGARADRTAALEGFVRTEAEQVSSSGEDVIFEVMSRADRKVVHDVVSEFDEVATESIGEDPRRRVILRAV